MPQFPPEPDVEGVPSSTAVAPEPAPDPVREPAPDPVAEPDPVPAPDPVAEPDPVPAPAPDPVAEPAPELASDPALEPVPTPEPVPEPVPEPEPVPDLASEPTPELAPPPPPRLPLRPVRRIPASGEAFGAYTLGESLGHGGFAHVYSAEDEAGEPVAIKVLTGLPDDARQRFAQEAGLLERLDGRGFPRYVTADLEAPQPWFAMELVPGSTLLERVRAQGPLTGEQTLGLAQQVVDALLVLQEQRCLHRDLKPANIMVDGDRAVLIDLGIAKVFDAATSTQPAGTVSYMAPELFARKVHPRSDVYSLGLLLVFALAGSLPPDLNFLGRDLEAADLVEPEPGKQAPELDKHLLPLVLAMTRYQPAHRPPLENIARVLAARASSATPDPTLTLTDHLLAAGVTKAEKAVLPATQVLAERPTKIFERGQAPGGAAGSGHGVGDVAGHDEARDTPVRFKEPWHGLVYDRELMRVLSEVHADGFDGAASQVIADHVGSLGVDAAEGHTPAEIKDWIWQAMRWEHAAPPEGHADTLRGWQSFRRPPEAKPAQQARATAGEPATVVTTATPPPSISPRPNTMRRTGTVPRSSSVRRLGPVPERPSPVVHLGPTPQPPSVQPRNAAGPEATQQITAARPGTGTRAPVQQTVVQRPPAQPVPQPAAQPVQRQRAPRPVAQPRPAPVPQQRPAPVPQQPQRPPAYPQQPHQPQRKNAGSRFGGFLLRSVPRLLLLAAVVLVVGAVPGSPFPIAPTRLAEWLHFATDVPRELTRYAEGPVAAGIALVVALMLRAAGHRMHRWFYVLGLLLVTAAAGVNIALSFGSL
ncbi:serine/threonine protein kinase [Myceligenerans crystallogenes]|uniref:Protein kinase domain-containing protein n=1 Tax=Myceligenerans crystallogenes TaxID=316335 RepID=A0ABN2NIX8_9MICO